MKIFILIFVVAFIGNENTGGASAVALSSNSGFTPDAVIHQLFELLRNVIRNGSTEHQIPVLDSYYIQQANFNLDDEIFRVDMNVTNGTLKGLGDFHVQQIHFLKTEVAIELNMNWPFITYYSEYYELEGYVKNMVPLMGHGAMAMELHAFELRGQIYLRPSSDGKSILIDDIKNSHYTVQKVKSRTEIDGNVDVIFNAMVEDLLAGYLTRFSKFLAARYSDSIIQHLNLILDKFDSWNIIIPIL